MNAFNTFLTQFGLMTAEISHTGAVCGLWFEGQRYFPEMQETNLCDLNAEQCLTIEILKVQLEEYFRGRRRDFDINVELNGTEFQITVWGLLKQISWGKTISYGELSGRVAKLRGVSKMSARAVGSAVGRNPVSIIIPCHRVIGSDGSLTGYAGGIELKQKLLNLEK